MMCSSGMTSLVIPVKPLLIDSFKASYNPLLVRYQLFFYTRFKLYHPVRNFNLNY